MLFSQKEVSQFSDLLRVIALSPRNLFAASLGEEMSEPVKKLAKYLGIYQKLETLMLAFRRDSTLPLGKEEHQASQSLAEVSTQTLVLIVSGRYSLIDSVMLNMDVYSN